MCTPLHHKKTTLYPHLLLFFSLPIVLLFLPSSPFFQLFLHRTWLSPSPTGASDQKHMETSYPGTDIGIRSQGDRSLRESLAAGFNVYKKIRRERLVPNRETALFNRAQGQPTTGSLFFFVFFYRLYLLTRVGDSPLMG